MALLGVASGIQKPQTTGTRKLLSSALGFSDVGLKSLSQVSASASGLQRILEKTLEAEEERAGWDWPERGDLYLRHTYCFYILDTVRMSFSCQGYLGFKSEL